MTTTLTLISTIYSIEPVIVCATRFSPSCIILLTEEKAPEEKERAEKMITDTLGSVLRVEKKYTSLYDVVKVAKDVAAIIEEENAKVQRIIVNVSGGRKPQAFGALFGSYARKEMVEQVVYVTEEDMISTSEPFLIEHKISGELIGCSDILSVDCYDYLHNIMFDVKTGIKKEEVNPFKLYATGYALVFESIYEIPVDIGCTVFLNFKDDRLLVERDIFHISDDLRSWWIEERDKKAEMVYEEKDPGMAQCERRCMYAAECMTV